jgi:signal transduction histidine kinase
MTFPGGAGRWEIRRSTFRERGLPHQLLVLSDLSRALREEERQAWQRLVRVLGHELNNSLAPIKSIAATLENLLVREQRPADWHDDMRRGLAVITARAEALSRFMGAYARLARLPQPRRQPMNVGAWIRRVVGLETRLSVVLVPGPDLTIKADGDQLEQLLINLLRNAADAALETGGGVKVGWTKNATHLEVWIEDEGPGLSNTANLFVPFFTTKPGGTGIGLVLSRQIAEAHGGTLTLENRRTGAGCVARLRLPLQ